jgi:hypothetical protein
VNNIFRGFKLEFLEKSLSLDVLSVEVDSYVKCYVDIIKMEGKNVKELLNKQLVRNDY